MEKKNAVIVVIGSAAVGILLRLLYIWTGWAEGSVIADDAYYYFVIADNVASGLGSTFDGLSATNGYHPLWLVALIPVFAAELASIWTPVRLALTLCTLFDTITGVLLYRVFSSSGLTREGVVSTAIWFLAPYTLFLGLRGLEASLSTLIIMVLFVTLLRIGRNSSTLTVGSAIAVGFIVGLAGLARTDNLVSLGMVVLVFALSFLLREGRSLSVLPGWLAGSGVTSALVMLPWFIWNYSRFGSIVQVSGQTKYYSSSIFGALTTDWSSIQGAIKSLAYPFLSPIIFPLRNLTGEEFQDPAISFAVVAAFLLMLVVPLIAARRIVAERIREGKLRLLFQAAASYLVAHSLLFGFVWRSYATWYALPSFLVIAMILGVSIPAFWQRTKSSRVLKVGLVGLIVGLHVAIYALFVTRLPHQPMRPETSWTTTLDKVDKLYDSRVTAGAFNAGAVGYVAQKYDSIVVVNLDCLVNNEGFRAVRNNQYLAYLTSTVDLFLENPEFAKIFLSDTEVDSLKALYPQLEDKRIWSRRKSDSVGSVGIATRQRDRES